MKKVFLLFILLIGFHQPLLAEELESDPCEQISSNTLICTNQQGYAYEKKIEGQNMDIETIEREKEKRNKQKNTKRIKKYSAISFKTIPKKISIYNIFQNKQTLFFIKARELILI